MTDRPPDTLIGAVRLFRTALMSGPMTPDIIAVTFQRYMRIVDSYTCETFKGEGLATEDGASVMPVSQCFRCDGDGQICNICGESKAACGCASEDIKAYVDEHGDQFDECPDCEGSGQ